VLSFVARPLWRDFDVFLHDATTVATVQAVSSRGSVTYSYQISGESFQGSGYGGRLAPIKIGSAIEIHYSTKHPANSTLESPLTRPSQIFVILVLAGIAGYFIWRKRIAP
jgi:hypothetical protein